MAISGNRFTTRVAHEWFDMISYVMWTDICLIIAHSVGNLYDSILFAISQ